MENENVLNDTQEQVVDVPETEPVTSEVESTIEENLIVETEEVATPQQSKEENAQFAKIRREADQKAQKKVDQIYKDLYDGQPNPYTGKPIESEADFLEYKQQHELAQQAEARGVSVEEQKEWLESLKKEIIETDPLIKQQNEELNYYRQREIENLIAQDLKRIQALDPKVKNLNDLGQDFAKLIGAGIDAVTAYNAVKANTTTTPTMGDVIEKNINTPENKFANMSDEDFERYIKMAERGELKK